MSPYALPKVPEPFPSAPATAPTSLLTSPSASSTSPSSPSSRIVDLVHRVGQLESGPHPASELLRHLVLVGPEVRMRPEPEPLLRQCVRLDRQSTGTPNLLRCLPQFAPPELGLRPLQKLHRALKVPPPSLRGSSSLVRRSSTYSSTVDPAPLALSRSFSITTLGRLKPFAPP